MGADDYITKPFDHMELLNAIERRLEKFETLYPIMKRSKNSLIEPRIIMGSLTLESNSKTRSFQKERYHLP